MRRFLSGALALALSAALCLPAQAAAGAEIIRAFVYDGTLYTYMSIDGTDRPITKAEVKIRNQTFSAGCRLETVRQAGAPVTWLLLVDNSDSMPAFREDVENFAESLAQSGGEDSRFILASFGDAFAVANEDVPAEELAEAVEGLPLDERVTRLHTAIDQAVSYFESVSREGNELRCLVVLSDGVQYDPSGGMPYEELLERVEQSDVMLHSIGLGDDAQSLESMGKLAAASGGVHQVLGEELSPKDAGTALTEASGELFITGFDLSGGTFSGGVETAAVTLASGGELLCRAETEVELPARDGAETAPPAQAPSLPDSQADASGGTVLPEAGAPEDGGWPVLPILGAAAALAAVFTVVLAVVLLAKRKRPAAPASPPPAEAPGEEIAAPAGIYMRLEVLQGETRGAPADLELREELVIGGDPDCGIPLQGEGVSPRHARVFFSGGSVWLEDLGSQSGTFINGTAIAQPAVLRSGDQITAGDMVFRLRF